MSRFDNLFGHAPLHPSHVGRELPPITLVCRDCRHEWDVDVTEIAGPNGTGVHYDRDCPSCGSRLSYEKGWP